MERLTIRLKVQTNKNINMIVAIEKNKTMQELAHRVLNCFHELANQHSKTPPKRRDLAVSALKLDGYYISKSQIVGSMLCDQDQIECILSKARPKYPNQPLTYESSKKLVPQDNWYSSSTRQLSPPKNHNSSIINSERKEKVLEGAELMERNKKQIKKDKKKNKLKQKNREVLLQQSQPGPNKKKVQNYPNKNNKLNPLVIKPLQSFESSKMEEQEIEQKSCENQKEREELPIQKLTKDQIKLKKEVEQAKNEFPRSKQDSSKKLNEQKMQQEEKQKNQDLKIQEKTKEGQKVKQKEQEKERGKQVQFQQKKFENVESEGKEENPFDSEEENNNENVNIVPPKDEKKNIENADVDSSLEEPILNIYNKNKKKKKKNKVEKSPVFTSKVPVLTDSKQETLQRQVPIQKNKINTIIGMLQKVNEQKQKKLKKKQKKMQKLEENELQNKMNVQFGNIEQNLHYQNKIAIPVNNNNNNNNKIASPKVTFHTSPLNSPQIISLNSPKRKFSNPSVEKLDKLDLQENLDLNKSLKKSVQSQKKPLQPIQEIKKGSTIQGAPKIIVEQQSQAQSPDMPNKKQEQIVSFKKLQHVSNPKIAALQATLSKYNINFQDSEDDEQ